MKDKTMLTPATQRNKQNNVWYVILLWGYICGVILPSPLLINPVFPLIQTTWKMADRTWGLGRRIEKISLDEHGNPWFIEDDSKLRYVNNGFWVVLNNDCGFYANSRAKTN